MDHVQDDAPESFGDYWSSDHELVPEIEPQLEYRDLLVLVDVSPIHVLQSRRFAVPTRGG